MNLTERSLLKVTFGGNLCPGTAWLTKVTCPGRSGVFESSLSLIGGVNRWGTLAKLSASRAGFRMERGMFGKVK